MFFDNKKKEEEKQPDFTGNGKDPDGKEFLVFARKRGQDGSIIGGTLFYKNQQDNYSQVQDEPDVSDAFNDDDDTPF